MNEKRVPEPIKGPMELTTEQVQSLQDLLDADVSTPILLIHEIRMLKGRNHYLTDHLSWIRQTMIRVLERGE